MKKSVDDKLNDIFDVQGKIVEQSFPVVEQVKEPVSTGAPNDESIDADYEYARENLKLFIEQGKVAMENIIFLAKEGESPRAYEVVGQLLKIKGDAAKDLLALQNAKKKLRQEDPKKQNIDTQNNIIFSGSTSDLLKALKAEKAKVIEHDS